ncbi:MAG: hypothetical protein FJX68_14355 [Alphaproteobacteria bacterium]|nr:hypothetical protein [Alphaproteobacteria bacterium]
MTRQAVARVLKIGAVTGSDAIRELRFRGQHEIDVLGNNDAWRLLHEQRERLRWRRLQLTPGYFRRDGRWNLDCFDLLFNLISDADQNPRVLEIAHRLLGDGKRPVINAPEAVMRTTRNGVARLLADLPGVTVPRVERLSAKQHARDPNRLAALDFPFPAILRRVGSHTGQTARLCANAAEVALALAGQRHDHYLTEFVDFRSPDGVYRKFRIFVFGEQLILRHMLADHSWNIHAAARGGMMLGRMDLQAEERAYFADGLAQHYPGAWAGLRRLRARIGLDYFGIDCHLTGDGRVVVFEVNGTMNFYPLRTEPQYAYVAGCIAPSLAAMRALLESKASAPDTTAGDSG